MLLTKEQILQSKDLITEKIHVKEWGGDVCIKTLGAKEKDAFEKSCLNSDSKPDLKNFRAKFAAVIIVDEKGNRLFNVTDLEELGKKSSKVLDRIMIIGQKLCGMTKEDIEDMTKNL